MKLVRRSTRSLALAVLLMLPVAGTSCGNRDALGTSDAPRVKLPKPLRLPDQPLAAAYVANPADAFAMVRPWTGRLGPKPGSPAGPPQLKTPTAALNEGLSTITTPALAALISSAVNPRQPWAMVQLGSSPPPDAAGSKDANDETQEIIRLPVLVASAESLAAGLAKLEQEGRFGARRLPPATSGGAAGSADKPAPWFIWFDEGEGALSLARTPRGLVTGRLLEETYGDKPIHITLDPRALGIKEVPGLQRISARGKLKDLALVASFAPKTDPLADLPLTQGALSGLLKDETLALGFTSRWTGRKKAVKELISSSQRRINGLNFLVKGTVQVMANKGFAALRGWDGRFLVGVGPDNHLRLAYGAKEPIKNGKSVLRFIRSVEDNLDLAGSFMSGTPKLNLTKRKPLYGGVRIHVVTMSKVRSQVPKEFRRLLDDKGRLKIAMGWSERAGGGLVVVGARAPKVLERWLIQVESARSGAKTKGQLAAATLAIPPGVALSLNYAKLDPSSLLGLNADGGRYDVTVRHDPERNELRLRLRSPTPPAPARAPVKRPTSGSTRAPVKRAQTRSKAP